MMTVTWEQAVRSMLHRPEQAQLVRDCYYDRPPLAAAERYRSSAEWAEVRKLLPRPPGRAVDLGAGHGITSYALAKDGWTVTAVEPDPSDLVGRGAIDALATQGQLPLQALEGTGESIPLSAGAVDLAFARQMLHHARDLHAVCRELHRVLRPGGRLITLRDHVISSQKQLPAFLDAHPLHNLYGGENAFREDEYRHALQRAGFRIERVLRSFDSVINFAPHTLESLREEILARMPTAVRPPARGILKSGPGFTMVRALMSAIDRRPGRLVSFVCVKAST